MTIEPRGFDLLWEQGPCFVVAKPGGLLTQAPPGIDSLEVRVKEYLHRRDSRPHPVYLGVPHRIDRPASGALVLGHNSKTTRRLCEQFEDRTVDKVYWALVAGKLAESEGSWLDWIRKVPGEARAEIAEEGAEGVRDARLHFRVLAYFADPVAGPGSSDCAGCSWLEIRLETGRTHQIRVQAAHHGHPILGDLQYGSGETFGPATEDPRQRWIALHARRLQFHHPATRERVSVTATLPSHWPQLDTA